MSSIVTMCNAKRRNSSWFVFPFLVLFSLSFKVSPVVAQALQKLEFKPVPDAPMFIEREKAVIYIRSTIPGIFVNSTNPNFTFRKVNGKEGEWVLRINPNEAYMVSVGARGFLSTVPQRFVLKLREVQLWEVTAIKSDVIIEDGLGKLVITGTPVGGVVELDYIPTSMKVPGTFEKIKTGMHNVRVLSDNIYSVPENYQVVIERNKTFELKVEDKQEAGYLYFDTQGKTKVVVNDYSIIENGLFKLNSIPYENKQIRQMLLIKVPVQKKSYVEIHEPNYLTYKDSLEIGKGDTLNVVGERAELVFKDEGFRQVTLNNRAFLVSGNPVSNYPYRYRRNGDIYSVFVPSYEVVKITISKEFYEFYQDEFTVDAGELKYYVPQIKPILTQIQFNSNVDSVLILGSNSWVKDQPVNYDSLGLSNLPLTILVGNYKFKYAKKGYDSEFDEFLLNAQNNGKVKQVKVKLYRSNRLFTWKRFFFLAILGGGGYAAYEFLLKPDAGTEPIVFPTPPGFPTSFSN